MFELFVLKHKRLHINEAGDRNISELKHISHYIHFLEMKYKRMHKDEMQNYTAEQSYLGNINVVHTRDTGCVVVTARAKLNRLHNTIPTTTIFQRRRKNK